MFDQWHTNLLQGVSWRPSVRCNCIAHCQGRVANQSSAAERGWAPEVSDASQVAGTLGGLAQSFKRMAWRVGGCEPPGSGARHVRSKGGEHWPHICSH